MNILSHLKKFPLVHIWLCSIFVISSFITVALQACTLVLWPFSKRLYRDANGKLIELFWFQYVWLADYWSGSRLFIHCKKEDIKYVGTEHILLVLNHRYDVDWIAIWQLASRFNNLSGGKAIMKEEIKYLPIIGWSFYLSEQIFVKRNFAEDRTSLLKQLDNIATYHVPTTTIIFCEGTRYTEEKHASSQAFAKEKGVPGLNHLLLPRTKGFTLCVQAYKGKIPHLLDCTMAYTGGPTPSIYELLRGEKYDCHVYAKRMFLEEIPTETEEETSEFCHEMYRGKDDVYDYFVKHKTFEGYDEKRLMYELPRKQSAHYIMLGWMILVGLPILFVVYRVLTAGSMLLAVVAIFSLYAINAFARFMMKRTQSTTASSYGLNHNKEK